MEDFFYHGIWRMDWGLGNPNKTAALIATLMVASWGLTYIRRWGFWVALILFTGLGVCLIHTFSRGGLIALFAGMLPVIYFVQRPWPWFKLVVIGISVWGIIGFSLYLNAHERLGQGVQTEDRSITNRLELWKVAPQMMVDSPSGWGFGNSGNAYMQWYQPLNRNEYYRTLVNSHLTWLVELGWPGRFLYFMVWFSIFLLCWPSSRTRWFSIIFGIWLAYAVAATFSSVAESPWLWIVPGLGLIIALGYRVLRKEWPAPVAWTFPIGLASAALAALWLSGRSDSMILGSEKKVIWGKSQPAVWVVWNQKVMGSNYGRSLRKQVQSSDQKSNAISFGIAFSWEGVPDLNNETLVSGGMLNPKDKLLFGRLMGQTTNVTLINPFFSPENLGLSADEAAKIKILFGEFSQSPAVESWVKAKQVQKVDGVGDYFQAWPEIILSERKNVSVKP